MVYRLSLSYQLSLSDPLSLSMLLLLSYLLISDFSFTDFLFPNSCDLPKIRRVRHHHHHHHHCNYSIALDVSLDWYRLCSELKVNRSKTTYTTSFLCSWNIFLLIKSLLATITVSLYPYRSKIILFPILKIYYTIHIHNYFHSTLLKQFIIF